MDRLKRLVSADAWRYGLHCRLDAVLVMCDEQPRLSRCSGAARSSPIGKLPTQDLTPAFCAVSRRH